MNIKSFADPLLPTEARPAGKALDKTPAAEGGVKWSATKGTIIGESGATAEVPCGGHLPIPQVAGKITIEADMNAKGTGFTALALGRGNISGDFWRSLGIMVTVWPNGQFNLFTAGKNLLASPNKQFGHAEGANHVEVIVDTMARTVSVSMNGQPALTNEPLPKDANLEQITAAGFRFQEPVKAKEPVLTNFKVTLEAVAATGLEPLDYAMTFVTPDKEASLTWKVTSPGPTKDVPYVIHDYLGAKVAEGSAVQGEDGSITLTRTFPRGYAEIEFPAAGQTFGLVSLEAHEGAADPFFCMDAALTWLELGQTRREGLVKITGRSGIAAVRERFDGVFTPTPGVYQWEREPRKGETVRQLFNAANVKVLDILGSNSVAFGQVKGQSFPQFLAPMASQWAGVARHWESIWVGAESFNESDLRAVPADQYAPMTKTLSYALAEADSKVPMVNGVFGSIPPGSYFTTAVANGILADSDVISFHMYDQAPTLQQMVVNYREWLKTGKVEALPLWLSEFGRAWVKGPGRPPVDQDSISALEISALSIEAKACGLQRAFPFVFVYYEEGTKNFGMMGREATPLRSMGAYVQAISAVSNKDYLGDMKGLPESVKLARTFGGATGEWVTVLYTGVIDPAAGVAFPVKFTRLAGADGRPLEARDGKVPIPDGMTYVFGDATDFGPSLDKATVAMRLFQLGQNPLKQKRLASPIVMQLLAQDLPSKVSARRYLLSPETAKDLPLNVRFHNLSSAELTVIPQLALPGGKPKKQAEVKIPAMGYTDVAWKVDASGSLDIGQTRLITITAKSSGDVQPSPLALPVTMEGTMEQHQARFKTQEPLPITDLAKWQKNANVKTAFSIVPEKIWRMDFSSGENQGGWTYPRFALPETIDTAKYSGFLIRARLLKSGVPAIIAKSGADGKGGPSFWVSGIFPGDGNWHAVYVPFTEFTPGPGGVGDQNTRLNPTLWSSVEIGSGLSGHENAFEISDFILVGGA